MRPLHRIFQSWYWGRAHRKEEKSCSHLENAATDGHVAGEGALLVHVVALLRRLGGLEPKTDVLHVTHALALSRKKQVKDDNRQGQADTRLEGGRGKNRPCTTRNPTRSVPRSKNVALLFQSIKVCCRYGAVVDHANPSRV